MELILRELGAILDAVAPDFPNIGHREPTDVSRRCKVGHTPVPCAASGGEVLVCDCALGGGGDHAICRLCGDPVVWVRSTRGNVPVHIIL